MRRRTRTRRSTLATGDLEAMFTQAMPPLTTAWTERLGREPTYLYVFLSSVFWESIASLAAHTLFALNNPPNAARSRFDSKAMGVPLNSFDKSILGQRFWREGKYHDEHRGGTWHYT